MTSSLLIAPQWIGDAVMTEPLLRTLAARGERLTVGALPWVAPVYRAMPQVSQVIEFPFRHGGLQWSARRAMAKELAALRFDVAYVCPNSLKSALIPWWAGIRRRVGYVGEWRKGLLTHTLPNPSKAQRPPMVAFYQALAGSSAPQGETKEPRLLVERSVAEAVLSKVGLAGRAYTAVAPGAEYGSAKRWPIEHYTALCMELPDPVVLLGGPKDSAVCQTILRAVNALRPGQCADLSGKTSLSEAMAVIAGARTMVSNDSGLMHIAAALGVPQVAIFGSSSPYHTPPLNRRAAVIWLKEDPHYSLDCAPCFERECPLGHTRCLQDISPQRVVDAISQING